MPKRYDLADFWTMVEPEPNSGCFLWAGSIEACGYGTFGYNDAKTTKRRAHRVAFERYRASRAIS